MIVKFISTNVGFILHECTYTIDATNLYRKYATSSKGVGFGKTHHLCRKMRKTEPRGNVFSRLISLKTTKLTETDK